MSFLRTLRLPIVLALVAVMGIVGMLLLTGMGDGLAFWLAAAPLVAGVVAVRYQRGRVRGHRGG